MRYSFVLRRSNALTFVIYLSATMISASNFHGRTQSYLRAGPQYILPVNMYPMPIDRRQPKDQGIISAGAYAAILTSNPYLVPTRHNIWKWSEIF